MKFTYMSYALWVWLMGVGGAVACSSPFVPSFDECNLAAQGGAVCYVVTIHNAKQDPYLHVKMQFYTQADKTYLLLKHTDQRVFQIENLRLLSPDAWFAQKPEYNGAIFLKHPAKRWVQLEYRIKPGDAFSNREFTLLPDLLFAEGYESLYYPHNQQHTQVKAQFVFHVPEGWQWRTSLGRDSTNFYALLDREGIWDFMMLGGDLKIWNYDLENASMDAVFYGDNFTKQDALILQQILNDERQLFGDKRELYFLAGVAAYPTLRQWGASGSARQKSFRMFISGDPEQGHPLNIRDNVMAKQVAAHEMFHFWNGGFLKSVPDTKWFWEGFTDYYANLILLRSELINIENYRDTWNRTVLLPYHLNLDYFINKTQNIEVPGIATDVYYPLGALLALHWDTEIKLKSNGSYSLDDVMHSLFREAEEKQERTELTQGHILKHVKKFLPTLNVEEEIAKWVQGSTPVPIDMRGFTPCFMLEKKPMQLGTQIVYRDVLGMPKLDRVCQNWLDL